MILVDLNQVMIATLMAQINKTPEVDENLIRHMVLNCLRSYKKKYKEHGNMVICCDHRKNWRKLIFPEYKAHRKGLRQTSGLNWDTIFGSLNQLREDLQNHFPYRVVYIEGAEADDIIGVIVRLYHDYEFQRELRASSKELEGAMLAGDLWKSQKSSKSTREMLILSGDKDFVQLQRYPRVKQYGPVQGKWIKNDDPIKALNQQILEGDRGDGVPNFLTQGDVFVTKGRQKPLMRKKSRMWATMNPDDFCTAETKAYYQRNKTMIDLTQTPLNISTEIVTEFLKPPKGNKTTVLNYLIKKRLKLLIEHLEEF